MSDLNAIKNSEPLYCELSEQELDKVTGGGAKNQTKGASQHENLSLSFSEIKFEYTAQ